MVELYAYSEDPDQMPCSVVSDLGLHCLQIVQLLGVSSFHLVKGIFSERKEFAPKRIPLFRRYWVCKNLV